MKTRNGLAARLRGRAGFGLMELMIAVVVLGIGLLAMAAMMGSSVLRQRLTLSRAEHTLMAETKMDELRSYGMLPSTHSLRSRIAIGGSLTSLLTNYADSVQTAEGRWYYRRWTITAGTAGTRRAAIRVFPKVRRRAELSQLEFTSLLAVNP